MKNVRLAFFLYFSYVSVGCIASQLIPLINDAGYTAFEKSMILGGGALFSFLMSLWLGKKSDGQGRLKPSFYISTSLYIGFMILFYLIDSMLFKAFFLIGLIGVSRTLMSSCETIVLMAKPDNFGKYQSMGALGLISGSLLSAQLMPVGKGSLCILSSLISFFLIYQWPEKQKEKTEIKVQDFLLLLKNKEYIGYLMIFFFLMLMGFADQYIVVDKMVQLKASAGMISLKYALQAFMEIPIYLSIKKIFHKFSISKLLVFCTLMSALKFALYGFVSVSYMIIIVSLLQIFTHPIIVVLSKKLIVGCTPSYLAASSQIIGFAVYFGMSGFVASLLGQMLTAWFSFDTALYIFASFALFPFLIWYFMRKYGKVGVVIKNENISD
ncbi:MFS transporter [uncultured Traorella sp.]|uniref:MFS transporter n=1 Tax=uncultured Traorella sp. TaxID=1929048 RepID=UPI0025EB0B9E|nr:MFS transporter [uncultured Traorella sp.]